MRLSPYNAKCLIVYLLYCAYKLASGYFDLYEYDFIELATTLLIVPAISYSIFPFILLLMRACKMDTWKIVEGINDILNFVYLTIKEPAVKHTIPWVESLNIKYPTIWPLLKIAFYIILLVSIVAFYILIDDMY